MNQAMRWKHFVSWVNSIDMIDFDSKEDLFFSLLLKVKQIKESK